MSACAMGCYPTVRHGRSARQARHYGSVAVARQMVLPTSSATSWQPREQIFQIREGIDSLPPTTTQQRVDYRAALSRLRMSAWSSFKRRRPDSMLRRSLYPQREYDCRTNTIRSRCCRARWRIAFAHPAASQAPPIEIVAAALAGLLVGAGPRAIRRGQSKSTDG